MKSLTFVFLLHVMGKAIIVINGSWSQERTHYQSIKSILFCHLTDYNKAAIVHNISTQNCKQKSKVLVNTMKHTFQPSPTHWFGYFNAHCVLLSWLACYSSVGPQTFLSGSWLLQTLIYNFTNIVTRNAHVYKHNVHLHYTLAS